MRRRKAARPQCQNETVTPSPASAPTEPVVIRISPMAHLGIGFVAFALLAVVMSTPPISAVLFLIPIAMSAFVIRYRTVADRDNVTARSLFGSRTVPWDDIEGLRFGKGISAWARLTDGTEMRLPTVTFATLPLLTEVSDGRVPNPYA